MDSLPKNEDSEISEATQQELRITRIFDAPRALVFEAWTHPRHVAQWWGPHGFTNPVCELDLRPGGSMLIHMRAPDGSEYPLRGVYQEIVPPERLVFTTMGFEDKSGSSQLEVLHTVTFDDFDGKTKLTLQARIVKSTPEIAVTLAGMEPGWVQAFDRLEQSLRP